MCNAILAKEARLITENASNDDDNVVLDMLFADIRKLSSEGESSVGTYVPLTSRVISRLQGYGYKVMFSPDIDKFIISW